MRRLTLRPKTIALLAALLFLALSSLFSGCDKAAEVILCEDCPIELTNGTWSINYVDCNGDIKSEQVGVALDEEEGETSRRQIVDNCREIIRVSPVPTSN